MNEMIQGRKAKETDGLQRSLKVRRTTDFYLVLVHIFYGTKHLQQFTMAIYLIENFRRLLLIFFSLDKSVYIKRIDDSSSFIRFRPFLSCLVRQFFYILNDVSDNIYLRNKVLYDIFLTDTEINFMGNLYIHEFSVVPCKNSHKK